MYDIENYYQASTIEEAVKLLKEHPQARVISGGSDVLIKIREGKMAGTSLVSIRDIREIQGVWMAEKATEQIDITTTFTQNLKRSRNNPQIPVEGKPDLRVIVINLQSLLFTHFLAS